MTCLLDIMMMFKANKMHQDIWGLYEDSLSFLGHSGGVNHSVALFYAIG